MYPRKAWEVSYKRDRAAGISRYVDPGPSRERLRQLHEAHVPARTLARAAGLSDTAVREILDGSRTHVQRSTESRINRLSLSGIYAEQQTGHVPRIGAVRRLQALADVASQAQDGIDAAAAVEGGVVDGQDLAEQVLDRYPALQARRHERARVLSGGERRLLEISRALIMDPDILLIDEPSIAVTL